MTLTTADRETIERVRRGAPIYANIYALLAILDRLAAEENRQGPACRTCTRGPKDKDDKNKPCRECGTDFSFWEPLIPSFAAPSSPLPDAICARPGCGKRYGEHHNTGDGAFCTAEDWANRATTFLPSPDKPEQDEPENCPEFWQREINRLRTELEQIKVTIGLIVYSPDKIVDAKIAALKAKESHS